MATPGMGPQLLSDAEIKQKISALDNVPLFMKSLPSDDTDDAVIAALQNLAYSGTPDEIAQNFKEQGNEYFKGKRYREALGFYNQGVDARPTDPKLQETLLLNRAACNLELENFGSVLKDCSKALGFNAQSSKAFFRSAVALIALDRIDEALDCCERCLVFDPSNTAVKTIGGEAKKKKKVKDRKEKERLERIQKEEEAKRFMKLAFRERNLIDVPKPDGSANPYTPHFDLDDPTQTTLIIPTFFLYPQYATSDVIPEFVEDTNFGAHIERMFPPQAPPADWDVKREYIDGNLVVYAITKKKRLLKIGKKMTLRDVLRAAKGKDVEDGMEVKDGCLSFIILPKGSVEQKWVEDFKNVRIEAV